MNETLKQLDNVGANIIGLIADIPGMLRSSRVWVFLATAAVAYLTATQSGLQGTDAALAVFAEVILGTGTIIGKTIRSGSPTATETTSEKNMSLRAEGVAISNSSSTSEPVTQTTQSQISIPFNKESFLAEVEKRVITTYGVRNACTLFYTAQQLRSEMTFNNQKAWDDCKAFMVLLAEKAFQEVWQCSYDEALLNVKKPDEKNCTYPGLEYKAMQMGIEYYAILLELKKVKGT